MAGRAARLLGDAWRALGDPAARERYDVLIGVKQPGSGLEAPRRNRPSLAGTFPRLFAGRAGMPQ